MRGAGTRCFGSRSVISEVYLLGPKSAEEGFGTGVLQYASYEGRNRTRFAGIDAQLCLKKRVAW